MRQNIPERSAEDDARFYGNWGFGPGPNWREYHFRYGAFQMAFTRAELRLGGFIADLTSDALRPQPVANIEASYILASAFTGMRAAPLRDSLKRLLRNLRKPEQLQDDVGEILNQMGNIQYVRDLLTHRHVFPFEDGFYIDSMQAAREPDKEEVIYFTLGLLDDMTADLLRIPYRLFALLHPEHELSQEVVQDLAMPWRYRQNELRRESRMRPRNAQ